MPELRSLLVFCMLGLLGSPLVLTARQSAVVQKAQGVATSFYSATDGGRFARISTDVFLPARTRLGPLGLSSPGLVPKNLRLEINPVACSVADWEAFLAKLALLPADLSCPATLRAPDGRTYRLLSPPRVDGASLVSTTFVPPGRTTVPLRITLGSDLRPTLHLPPRAPRPAPSASRP